MARSESNALSISTPVNTSTLTQLRELKLALPNAIAKSQTKGSKLSPYQFRSLVRNGQFNGPTNGQCPGYLQCNLVVLRKADAFDFLLFCQRNPQACPLIEVCDVGSSNPSDSFAWGADLKTDVPKYAIYRHGLLDKVVENVIDHWPEDSVAFLIGCSFTYDSALVQANIPLRSVEQNKNVPMYRTNIPCRPAGKLRGNMVVSMKPIPSKDVTKVVTITNQYQLAHGGPVCVGCPSSIGIQDLKKPDWGDPVEFNVSSDVPVFYACGVTPQSILLESGVDFAITHYAGHMFISDRLAEDSNGI